MLEQIRNQIGDNDIEGAIRGLCDLLSGSAEGDLYDDAILQKSRWSDYKRRQISGLGEERELNSIRAALLNIARELENRARRPVEPPPERPKTQSGSTPPPPPPPQPQYTARCFFNGDPHAYFITPANQIVAYNPMLNVTNMVATRVPSTNPAFAWMYLFPNGFFYNVDHAGAIWGVNAFGMPVQMGYVQYL